jgi:hypothetical protein
MSATLIPMATYVLVANPATYKFVRGILGGWVANSDGVATLAGLVLHAFVYVILTGVVLMMFMPKSSGYDVNNAKNDASNGLMKLAMMINPSPAPAPQ